MVKVPDDYSPIKGWEEELFKIGNFPDDGSSDAVFDEVIDLVVSLIDTAWEDGYRLAKDRAMRSILLSFDEESGL